MGEIYDFTQPYPFHQLELITPMNKGGNYYIKMGISKGAQTTPIYIQPPKCFLKQKFFKSGKKMYCDLVFSQENEKFIQWLENLEQTCCRRIYDNRTKWFENDLEEHEIENYMTSPYKIYKSGKQYVIRVLVPTLMEACDLKIYDETEKEVSHADLNENTEVIVIMEFKGIKCAIRSFAFDIEIKQMLVLSPQKLFNKCIINVKKGGDIDANTSTIQHSVINVKSYSETAGTPTHENNRPDLEEDEEDEVKENTVAPILPDLEDAKNTLTNMSASENNDVSLPENATKNSGGIEEVEFNLEDLDNSPPIHLKERNDVYYKMYREAKKKAKEAKMLALSNYLEAKRIKTTYLLDEEDSDDSDMEDFSSQQNI